MSSRSRHGPINGVIILLFSMTCNDIEGMTKEEIPQKKHMDSIREYGLSGTLRDEWNGHLGYQVNNTLTRL